jgi:acyl-CoA synthetase (AMP-forming)/AMP-acid ligase II
LTNAGLLEHVRAARRHLHELGVGTGDVVALKLRNRVEFVVLLFACLRLGATVTPFNPSLTDAEVTLQLQASGARLLVVEVGAIGPGGVATLAVGNLYAKRAWLGWATSGGSFGAGLLIFTSGTTGVPKV